jgi:hypothetical protein
MSYLGVKNTPNMMLPLFKEFNMKKSYIFIFLIFVLFKSQVVFGQVLQLSFPVFQGVYQRNGSDNATIPVSGQVVGLPASPGNIKIECITNELNSTGGVIPNTTTTTLLTNNTSKGYFNGSITRSKGWYSLQVKYTFSSNNFTSSATTKFGVGDVFIIAGQSNGQGVSGLTYPSPSIPIPEWIVGNNEEWNCRKEFESRPSMTNISGTNLIGPSGNNSWCYGVLGKKISDANGGMPVAFFNTCATGSSVKNWSQGADGDPTLGYQNGNVQWCSNFPALSGNPVDYFYGQPYLTLKNTLNWYVPLFGVRAVLWHQGEADADNNSTNSVLSRTETLYRDYLNNVISKSREHSSVSNLSWMIARVSYSSFNTEGGTFDVTPSGTTQAENYAKNVRDSQGNSPTGVVTGSTLLGPITDRYNSASTGIYRNATDGTHFDEGNNSGLTILSDLWGNFIDPSSLTAFNRISPNPVPTISITPSGSSFIFSVGFVQNADYCWVSGSTLAPPINSSSCLSTLSSITVTNNNPIRCFVGVKNNLPSPQDATNWISTGAIIAQNCSTCREGVEESDETYGGINMKLYPNPTDKDFRIEFDVPEDDTHVKLEFFDMVGKSVKVIADGSHAKGHFTYPITEPLPTGASICQLKVGEIFISKKVMKVN